MTTHEPYRPMLSYIQCAGCGEIVDVPAELATDDNEPSGEPYYCDACDRMYSDLAMTDDDVEDFLAANSCPYCGKEYEDFSDLGCGHCDRRSPDWGLLP